MDVAAPSLSVGDEIFNGGRDRHRNRTPSMPRIR
jgi:hypothetical protein